MPKSVSLPSTPGINLKDIVPKNGTHITYLDIRQKFVELHYPKREEVEDWLDHGVEAKLEYVAKQKGKGMRPSMMLQMTTRHLSTFMRSALWPIFCSSKNYPMAP